MELPILAFTLLASIALIVWALWPKGKDGDDAIKRRMSGRTSSNPNMPDPRKQAKESIAKRMMNKVAPIAMRPVMLSNPEEMSKLRIKLAMAGMRADNAPTMFLSSKTIVAVGAALFGLTFALVKGYSTTNLIGITVFLAGMGFLAPNIWLSLAVSQRQTAIRHGLADTLDLMVISVESGLGLDAAMQRVGDEMKRVHPELSEEMQIVTIEAQMGIPRSEALVNMVNRTGIEETKALVAIINQAEKFGTSIARALRNQSDALRTRRRQEAEERAQKTTVKLMMPLILFIFPAILVVLAGPAALTMVEALSNNPALFGG